jgi:hypothetical protein
MEITIILQNGKGWPREMVALKWNCRREFVGNGLDLCICTLFAMASLYVTFVWVLDWPFVNGIW